MKRDVDLIRRIAFAIEERHVGNPLEGLPDVPRDVFVGHVRLMQDHGLVEAKIAPGWDDARITRLTWAGHEFLDAARDDTVWKKAKESVMKPTASWTFEVLKEWLKTEITNGLPTVRGLAGN